MSITAEICKACSGCANGLNSGERTVVKAGREEKESQKKEDQGARKGRKNAKHRIFQSFVALEVGAGL